MGRGHKQRPTGPDFPAVGLLDGVFWSTTGRDHFECQRIIRGGTLPGDPEDHRQQRLWENTVTATLI